MRGAWVPVVDAHGVVVHMEWRAVADLPSPREITLEDHLAYVEQVGGE